MESHFWLDYSRRENPGRNSRFSLPYSRTPSSMPFQMSLYMRRTRPSLSIIARQSFLDHVASLIRTNTSFPQASLGIELTSSSLQEFSRTKSLNLVVCDYKFVSLVRPLRTSMTRTTSSEETAYFEVHPSKLSLAC